MNKLLLSAVFAVGVVATPAFAGDVEAHCEALTAEGGVGNEACSCVGDVASGNQDVADAVLGLGSVDDADGMDDSVKEALSICFPEG